MKSQMTTIVKVREQVDAYLEPSSEKNMIYYQRYGFEVTGRIDLGKGGPPCWSMWRKPHHRFV